MELLAIVKIRDSYPLSILMHDLYIVPSPRMSRYPQMELLILQKNLIKVYSTVALGA